ncbi:hypothetical protein SUDANB58_04973 [Streptomyces sp. enrichment culture]|uniref:hypothetical protein n=1 Tax=Streptomyces sp. enrichment culture TaxID=1795815 RepID=UPI003F56DDD8
MHRTARALSVAVLAGAALCLPAAGPAAAGSAAVPAVLAAGREVPHEPAGESDAEPGAPDEPVGDVAETEEPAGEAPDAGDAGDPLGEATEPGTPLGEIAEPDGTAAAAGEPCPEGEGHDGSCTGGTAPTGSTGGPGGTGNTGSVGGTARPCPAVSATPAPPHGDPCGGAGVPRGVRAGQGGAFAGSVPALVAGGVLMAGAMGAAAHRLHAGGHRRNRGFREDGDR